MIRKVLFAAALMAATCVAQADVVLSEDFNNVGTLAGSGWSQVNNSTAGGSTGWFQGNTGVFDSQSGAADSYIAANFLNAPIGGDISNWLILPTMSLSNGETLDFYTRSTGSGFADRLEVRLSTNGASGDVGATTGSVGDFSTLLLTINPALAGDGYPSDWTLFHLTLSGIADGTVGRIAFRYNVTDTLNNADYIGIDSVRVKVPEPATIALFALGLLGVGAMRMSCAAPRGLR